MAKRRSRAERKRRKAANVARHAPRYVLGKEARVQLLVDGAPVRGVHAFAGIDRSVFGELVTAETEAALAATADRMTGDGWDFTFTYTAPETPPGPDDPATWFTTKPERRNPMDELLAGLAISSDAADDRVDALAYGMHAILNQPPRQPETLLLPRPVYAALERELAAHRSTFRGRDRAARRTR